MNTLGNSQIGVPFSALTLVQPRRYGFELVVGVCVAVIAGEAPAVTWVRVVCVGVVTFIAQL